MAKGKKEVVRIAKLQFLAGKSKPGPELAGLGIVMPEFTRQFNDDTKDRGTEPVPVEITVFSDKSFTYKLFTAPASYMLLQAAGIDKGSSNAKTTKVATIKIEQLEEIAKYKMVDLNAVDLKGAMKIVAGTAKNMGILIDGWDDLKKELKAAKAAAADASAAEAKEAKLEEEMQANIDNKDAEIEVVTTSQQAPDENEGDDE